MKNLTLILLTLLIASCSVTKVVMTIDPELEMNATVYVVQHPNKITDKISGKRLNVTFGPYQVSDADPSWTRTGTTAEYPRPLIDFSRTKTKTKTSGRITKTTSTTVGFQGGPTSVLGFSRTPEDGDSVIDKSFKSIAYKFRDSSDAIWNAKCYYSAEKRRVVGETSSETLWSDYFCHYTLGDKMWELAIYDDENITMTEAEKDNKLIGYTTRGIRVKENGEKTNLNTKTAGYTWADDLQYVGAIATKEEPPRVWLNRDNKKSLNDILAMANTGLIVYNWEILK